MFHDDGDRIGFGIQNGEERVVGTLRNGSLAQFLVIAKNIHRIFQIRGGKLVRHAAILSPLCGLSSPSTKSLRAKQIPCDQLARSRNSAGSGRVLEDAELWPSEKNA